MLDKAKKHVRRRSQVLSMSMAPLLQHAASLSDRRRSVREMSFNLLDLFRTPQNEVSTNVDHTAGTENAMAEPPGGRSSSERATSPNMMQNRMSDGAPPNGMPNDQDVVLENEKGFPQQGHHQQQPSQGGLPQMPASGDQQLPIVPGGSHVDPEVERQFEEVIHSDMGVEILLGRLKQCLSGHREMSTAYEKLAHSQKKASRGAMDAIRLADKKHGQFGAEFEEMMQRHDKMADTYGQFGLLCNQMWEELMDHHRAFDERRKHEKQTGLASEKRAQASEEDMLKSKQKRDRLAEQLDMVRTGDKQGGRFGRLGTKSAAQQEEDLNRKLQAADQEYQQKCQSAQSVRASVVSQERPQTVTRLVRMIRDLDAALVTQMQFYVNHLEYMSVSCGSQIVGGRGKEDPFRLANRVNGIDFEADLKNYVASFAAKIGNPKREIKYEPHQRGGYGGGHQQQPSFGGSPVGQGPPNNFGGATMVGGGQGMRNASGPMPGQLNSPPPMGGPQQHQRQFSNPMQPSGPPQQGSFSQGPPHLQTTQPSGGSFMGPDFQMSPQEQRPNTAGDPNVSGPMESGYRNPQGMAGDIRPGYGHTGPVVSQQQQSPQGPPGAPPGGAPQEKQPQGAPPNQAGSFGAPGMTSPPGAAANKSAGSPGGSRAMGPTLSPDRPTFNMRLQALYERDGSPVPIIVHQCLQAVDLFGLKVDGIYRVSGTAAHIARLRQMFDHNPAGVDLSNPENFFHDINSVAGLLKQFFRDLPGGLLTELYYRDFIGAAKIEDAVQRRNALHATINALPDTNYATLRALCLHLWRVQEHESTNRMTSANLAICFGPTILVPGTTRDLADAGWQVKAMETIFADTLLIFDEDG